MVAFRAHHEHRRADVLDRRRAPVDQQAARGEFVAEIEPAQVFRVHPVGHPRRIGVPGHQVDHRRAFAHQVVAHQPRPDQVVGPEELEGAGHLVRGKIAAVPHHAVEEMHLAVVDEERELPGFGEIRLGGEQGQRGEPVVPRMGHGRRRDGEQGAAEAIAGRMDAPPGQDGADGVERRHHPEAAVVVEGQAPVLGGRIAPGDAEDGVAPAHQPADQRIPRREVEDVVLHDPGRDDQHRLGEDGLGRGGVLDQLDQVVAVDHLARGDRHFVAGAEGLGARRGRAGRGPAQVVDPVAPALDEVHAPRRRPAGEDVRVGQRRVGGRPDVEHLPRGEGRHVLVVRVDPGHVAGGVVPPLLVQQEGLGHEAEGRLAPGLAGEAVVAGQGRDAGLGRRRLARQVACEPGRLAQRLVGELHPLAGGGGEMQRPVEEGEGERGRGEAAGRLAHHGVERSVEGAEGLAGQRAGQRAGQDVLSRVGRAGGRRLGTPGGEGRRPSGLADVAVHGEALLDAAAFVAQPPPPRKSRTAEDPGPRPSPGPGRRPEPLAPARPNVRDPRAQHRPGRATALARPPERARRWDSLRWG